MTTDFFRARLQEMVDPRHPSVVLAGRMPWETLEAALAPNFARPSRDGRSKLEEDLLGPTLQVVGAGVSPEGRPRLPIRLMAALLYLKHAYNLSDEALVERWAESVPFQYFSGGEYYEHRLPCDPTQIGRFRKAIGEEGVEYLLKATLQAAVSMNAIQPSEFERVIVDSTVQEKAIAHPTDSRLLEIARYQVVKAAKQAGIVLKQTYAKEAKDLRRKAGGYAHARQFKRLRRTVKRQRTILGVILREIDRKLPDIPESAGRDRLMVLMQRAERIRAQKPKDKNKLYAMHAPEAECIGKVRHEVASVIVSARRGDETGRSVDCSLPAHASLVTVLCEAAGTIRSGHMAILAP